MITTLTLVTIHFHILLTTFPMLNIVGGGLVTTSCLTFAPLDCSPPGYSVHGIFHARILERVAISFSRFCTLHSFIYFATTSLSLLIRLNYFALNFLY